MTNRPHMITLMSWTPKFSMGGFSCTEISIIQWELAKLTYEGPKDQRLEPLSLCHTMMEAYQPSCDKGQKFQRFDPYCLPLCNYEQYRRILKSKRGLIPMATKVMPKLTFIKYAIKCEGVDVAFLLSNITFLVHLIWSLTLFHLSSREFVLFVSYVSLTIHALAISLGQKWWPTQFVIESFVKSWITHIVVNN
jgi:hypothetical protein